jgi:hypothetical protein
MVNRAKLLSIFGIGLISAFAVADLASAHLQAPLGAVDQTVVTESTRVVVVFIPGFPIESVLIGILLGLGLLHMIRKRRFRRAGGFRTPS